MRWRNDVFCALSPAGRRPALLGLLYRFKPWIPPKRSFTSQINFWMSAARFNLNRMQNDLPQPDKASLIHKFDSILHRIDPKKIFPKAQPLEVELGAGDGSFLAKYAAAHREHNFIGVERLLGRLRKIEKKSLRAGLENIALFRIEASYFLEFLLPEKSVSALHVYFPDPWPKRKHRKNRLVNERFTELAGKVLLSGGTVFLRTDDADYFSQMTRVFDANSAFEKLEVPAALLSFVTDFERNFHLRDVPTLAAAYRLK
jgi:tRNA (guanine-N7-)-methyltransferase